MDKAEVARRQLGTALDLYLRGRDPISVHCLVCGGGEIAEHLAANAGATAFREHAFRADLTLTTQEFRNRRNQYWNSFKHATKQNGKPRNDEALLTEFSGALNAEFLFVGWFDYGLVKPTPIEVHVFGTWFLAKHPEKIPLDYDASWIHHYFPALASQSAEQQLQRLNDGVRKARKKGAMMDSPKVEKQPLVLP